MPEEARKDDVSQICDTQHQRLTTQNPMKPDEICIEDPLPETDFPKRASAQRRDAASGRLAFPDKSASPPVNPAAYRSHASAAAASWAAPRIYERLVFVGAVSDY